MLSPIYYVYTVLSFVVAWLLCFTQAFADPSDHSMVNISKEKIDMMKSWNGESSDAGGGGGGCCCSIA